jgi:hypothetical protein
MNISNDTFEQNQVLTRPVVRAVYCEDRGVASEWTVGILSTFMVIITS